MNKRLATAAVGTVLAAVGMGAGIADAKSPRTIERGACSGAADWKLKLGAEDANRLEVQLEIEDARPGSSWRVTTTLNGSPSFSATRRADARGHVRVNRVVQGRAGADTVTFRATSAGQTCTGSATL